MKTFNPERQTVRRLAFSPFCLYSDVDILYLDEKVAALEPRAVRVLRLLIENRQRVVSKRELLDTVWSDVFTTEDVLKKAVSQIRRALKDDLREPRYIETHHRRGYRFIAEVADDFDAPDNFPASSENKKLHSKSDEIASAARTELSADADFNQFIGRQTEIETLRSEYRRALNGSGQPILIVGDPGIGKTQLSARFECWAKAERQAVFLRARFYDYEAARISAGDLFLDLLKEALIELDRKGGNSDEKNPDLQILAARLKIELPVEINSFGDQSPSPRANDYQIAAPLAEAFIAISRARPLVLIFDDLQWADDLSRKIIGYLMRAGAAEKILILALARRAECENSAHEFAVWLNAQAIYRSFSTLSLQPLTENDFGELIGEAFGGRLDATAIPYRESNLIYRTTGGNPYFLIETLRMLLAENVIEKSVAGDAETVWKWRGLSDVPLPETIRMAARGKLNRLTQKTKDYVEHAAVLGDAFSVETLHAMFGGETLSDEDDELENCLLEAIRSQVLTEQNVSGADDCQFYHTTLRRAIYADLSPRRRKRLHLRAAKAFETTHAAEFGRIAVALSVHYEASGEMLLCFERALAATAHAGKNFDWREAAECAARANRAAEILDKNPATRLSDENNLRLLLTTGEAIMSVGKREEAETTLEKAATLAGKLNDTASLAVARATQGHARVLLGRYREALESSTEALELSEQLKDDEGIADALLQIGSAQYTLGEFNLACETLQKVIDRRHSGDYRKAVALGKIGWVRALQGRYSEGKDTLENALRFHKTAGDARQRIVLFLCLNWCEHGLGRYESAIRYAAEARRQAHQNLGEIFSEAVAATRIGKARLAQGLYLEAATIFEATLLKLKNTGNYHCEAEILWFLGRTKIALDQTAEARRLLDRALLTIREIGDREDEFRILIDIAELEILGGAADEALKLAENAVVIASELEIADGIGAALIAKARALLKMKRFAAAREAVERAIELLDAAESGERWRGYATLAEVLRATAENEINQFAADQTRDFQPVEAAWRRTLELLAEIHRQFDAADERRANLFLQAHRQPAELLHELLVNSDRQAEAADVAQLWQLA